MLTKWGKTPARRAVEPLLRRLIGTRISPNVLTVVGLALNLGVAAVLGSGRLVLGGFLVLGAGAFDMLDGTLARLSGRTTRFGAFLDSTLDRYSEAIILLGLLVAYLSPPRTPEVLLIFVTLVGSYMISYARARAEGLGLDCEVGWLPRPERIFLLALGLIIGQVLPMLIILAVLTNFTAAQRIVHVWRLTGGK